jgi:hypothetical protein
MHDQENQPCPPLHGDTLKFANKLKSAGFTNQQAEAEALSEVLEVNMKEFAAKADLEAVEQRLNDKLVMR